MMMISRRCPATEAGSDGHMECARALGLLTVCLRAEMTLSESIIVVWRNSKGEIRKLLERSLRKAALGSSRSLVETLEEGSKDLPNKSERASQPLIELLRAESEPDTDQKHALIEKAHENALRSCRQAVRDDVASLRVPFSTIFAMGIVLPIIIATILPLWGMVSNDDVGAGHAFPGIQLVNPEPRTDGGIVIAGWLTILAFPMLCILAANRLIRHRELISDPEMNGLGGKLLITFAALAMAILPVALFAGGSTAFFLVVGVLISVGVLANRILSARSARRACADHAYSPSVLSAICGRLSQGEHFLRAILLSINDSRLSRELLGDTLFRADKEHISPFNPMEEASKKDPRIAARVFRQFSAHLSELEGMERDLRSELRPIAQSALVATLALCPFVLGIVAGFNSFGYSDGGGRVDEFQIKTVFAVFVAEMALTGYWLAACLSPDRKGMPRRLFEPRGMTLLSIMIFLGSLELSGTMFS